LAFSCCLLLYSTSQTPETSKSSSGNSVTGDVKTPNASAPGESVHQVTDEKSQASPSVNDTGASTTVSSNTNATGDTIGDNITDVTTSTTSSTSTSTSERPRAVPSTDDVVRLLEEKKKEAKDRQKKRSDQITRYANAFSSFHSYNADDY
jgi:hypothetical protein